MKYIMDLSNFTAVNENLSVDAKVAKLQEFCNDHLAYLLDYEYSVKVFVTNNLKESLILFSRNESLGENIKWADVKDNIETFLEYLSHNYDLLKISISIRGKGVKKFYNLESFLKIEKDVFQLLTIIVKI